MALEDVDRLWLEESQLAYEEVTDLVKEWERLNSQMLKEVIRASEAQYARAVNDFERCDAELVAALKSYDPINEKVEVNGWFYVVVTYGYIQDGDHHEGETVIQI